jgi:hypothetical protein
VIEMVEKEDEAAECRRIAAGCIEIAQRMSARSDREPMMEMAQHWLELAKKVERKATHRMARLKQGRSFTR